MKVKAFADEGRTWTVTYVVFDEDTHDAVVIDPVLDLDTTPWRTYTESIDQVAEYIKQQGLHVHWILDTHVHADHISGAAEFRKRLGAPLAIGTNVKRVQEIFKQTFNFPDWFPTDGSQFDRLLNDGDKLAAGALTVEVLHTPGHTPACCTYHIGGALFTGDVLFQPDIGVARCDFPDGSARTLYRSVNTRLYSFPDETRVYVGHDYPDGRAFACETSIGESKRANVDLPDSVSEDDFVSAIEARDSKLPAPRLLFPSLQVNINGGELPDPEDNDIAYLKVPINYL